MSETPSGRPNTREELLAQLDAAYQGSRRHVLLRIDYGAGGAQSVRVEEPTGSGAGTWRTFRFPRTSCGSGGR
jgi:hypothetical protein